MGTKKRILNSEWQEATKQLALNYGRLRLVSLVLLGLDHNYTYRHRLSFEFEISGGVFFIFLHSLIVNLLKTFPNQVFAGADNKFGDIHRDNYLYRNVCYSLQFAVNMSSISSPTSADNHNLIMLY